MLLLGIFLWVLTVLWAMANAFKGELDQPKEQLTWVMVLTLAVLLIFGIFVRLKGG